MNFLKKFGAIIVKATAIATGFQGFLPAPAQPVAATVINDLNQLISVIVMVEAAGQALHTPGPDKLKMAAPLIAQAILQSQFMVNKKVQDEAKFKAACEGIASSLADLLNSIDGSGVKEESKT